MKQRARLAFSVYGTTRLDALEKLMFIVDKICGDKKVTDVTEISAKFTEDDEDGVWEAYADVGLP